MIAPIPNRAKSATALFSLALALAAGACAAPQAAVQTRALDAKGLSGARALARATLEPGASYVPPVGQLSAVAILTKDTKKSRRMEMCEAWRAMPTTVAMAADSPGAPVNATYWPISRTVAAEANCTELVAAYDYDRAAVVASRFGALGAAGPGLVVIQDPSHSFFMDMSRANGRTIDQGMKNWYAVSVDASAKGKESYTPDPGGSLLSSIGKISCSALGVVELGIPVVNIAGELLCQPKA